MDSKAFFEKVKRMREAQRKYFQHRSPTYLNESKKLEKEIDDEIKRVDSIITERNNPKLEF